METIKTFFNNATKETEEERESYPTSGANAQTTRDTLTERNETSGKSTGKSTSSTGTNDTVDTEVTSQTPVVHERVHRTIVDENQTVVDKEHHQDHYKKKIQPVAVSKNDETVQSTGQRTSEEKSVDNRKANTDATLEAQDDKVKSTREEDVTHESTQKPDIVNEATHHHVHERVQPVLEKDVYQKEVRHNQKNVHEVIQDEDAIEQTETLPTIEKNAETLERTNLQDNPE